MVGSDTILRRVIKEHNLDTNKEFQAARAESSGGAVRGFLRAIGLASSPDAQSDASLSEFAASPNSGLMSADEIAEAIRLAPFVDVIKRNLSIEPVRESRVTVKDTRLIEVAFRNTDPQLAAFVVNGIGETFSASNQEQRSGTSRKTSDFLQQRIADLQSDIRRDELKLVELERTEGILKTPGDQTIVLERLAGLNKDLLTAENERKTAEAQFLSVRNNPERVSALAEAESARYITEREKFSP